MMSSAKRQTHQLVKIPVWRHGVSFNVWNITLWGNSRRWRSIVWGIFLWPYVVSSWLVTYWLDGTKRSCATTLTSMSHTVVLLTPSSTNSVITGNQSIKTDLSSTVSRNRITHALWRLLCSWNSPVFSPLLNVLNGSACLQSVVRNCISDCRWCWQRQRHPLTTSCQESVMMATEYNC